MEVPRGAVKPTHPLFIERNDVVSKIYEKAKNGTSVLLTGPYMTGKSTVLLDVVRHMRDEQSAVPVFVDLAVYGHLELVNMLQSIYAEVLQIVPGMGESDGKILSAADSIDSPWNFGLAILGLTETLAVPLVIILDEIQRVENKTTLIQFALALRWTLERAKRPPFEKDNCLSFILSGVIDPNELIDGARSPFNTADRVMIFDLMKEEMRSFLMRQEVITGESTELVEKIINIIFEETGGNPYLVQLFANEMGKQSAAGEDEMRVIAERITGEFTNEFDCVLEKIQDRRDIQELAERIMSGEQMKYEFWDMDVRYARLAGIIRKDEDGYCRIRGRIYERILESLGWGNLVG